MELAPFPSKKRDAEQSSSKKKKSLMQNRGWARNLDEGDLQTVTDMLVKKTQGSMSFSGNADLYLQAQWYALQQVLRERGYLDE